jgi:hypothetical protein
MTPPASFGQDAFYGKYRGTVVNNVDPQQRGRLQLLVPDVTGTAPTSWAEPCVPLAGPAGTPMGFFLVPPVGAAVWAEFERGDPSMPIWTGCRWGQATDLPSFALVGPPASPNVALQTLGRHLFIMSDLPSTPSTGGILLRSATGAMLLVNDLGVFIDNGKGASLKMLANMVVVNDGALKVI